MDKDTVAAMTAELDSLQKETLVLHLKRNDAERRMIVLLAKQLKSCGSESGRLTVRISRGLPDHDFSVIGWEVDENDCLWFIVRHDHEVDEDGDLIVDKVFSHNMTFTDLCDVWVKVMANCGYISR